MVVVGATVLVAPRQIPLAVLVAMPLDRTVRIKIPMVAVAVVVAAGIGAESVEQPVPAMLAGQLETLAPAGIQAIGLVL